LGDEGIREHKFTGVTIPYNPWCPEIETIKDQINQEWNLDVNYCLVNHYRDGNDGIGMHVDNDLNSKRRAACTLSLGSTRTFILERLRGDKQKITFPVKHGDLLLILDETQKHWKHGIERETGKGERYSLTFRKALMEELY